MKMGLGRDAVVGEKLVSLSAVFKSLPHHFVVTEIREAGDRAVYPQTLVEANGMIHSPLTCGTPEQYATRCHTIAVSVSGNHDFNCPICKGKGVLAH